MDTKELKDILDAHKNWVHTDGESGERADLLGASLKGVYLYEANLKGADFRYADLRGADLRGADLRGADLYDANLQGADLRDANLQGADLQDADLRDANLQGADLRDANLQGADLRDANLEDTQVTPFSFPKGAFGFHHEGYIQIGCEGHTVAHWKEHYKEIGKKHEYNNELIEQYGNILKGF